MGAQDSSASAASLSQGLMRMLRHRQPPPKHFSEQEHAVLYDLVQALTQALSRGEISIDLGAGGVQPEGCTAEGWPETHRRVLAASGWLTAKPALMVMEGDLLHWRRWHQGMTSLETALLQRSSMPPCGLDAPRQAGSGPSQRSEGAPLNAEQQDAVNAISHHRLVLLSGGPGTGKTSTVRAMLLRAMAEREGLRIHLAAPTGKAARRLQEAIRCDPRTSGLPCTTLHRLLQARPAGFNRNRRHPLPVDLLVVDEVSMVDLSLAQALNDALPADAQLVLVGDANQLPPIGVGAVWQHLQSTDRLLRFGNAAVRLHRVYRNRGELARLSGVLCHRSIEDFWTALAELPTDANIQLLSTPTPRLPELVLKSMKRQLTLLRDAARSLVIDPDGTPDPAEAHALLDHLDALIVLCPRRRGIWGVDTLHSQLISGRDAGEWPEGLPVLCGDNQPEIGLANGDLGVCIGEGGSRRLLFRCSDESGSGAYRLLHPARIRGVEPALALTIHKAQGSEADEVLLLWPPMEETTITSLLYTAITRARQQLTLVRLASETSSGML